MAQEKSSDAILNMYKKYLKQNRIWHVYILFFAVIFGFILSFTVIDLSIIVYIKVLSLYILSILFAISFFYFSLNELQKFISYEAIITSINSIKHLNWKLVRSTLIDRPVGLHQDLLFHPVSLLIIGSLYRSEGEHEVADYFIQEARDKCPTLKNINFASGLCENDYEQLIQSIKNDKSIKRFSSYHAFWAVKTLRYSIIMLCIILLVLHYLVQISNIYL